MLGSVQALLHNMGEVEVLRKRQAFQSDSASCLLKKAGTVSSLVRDPGHSGLLFQASSLDRDIKK